MRQQMEEEQWDLCRLLDAALHGRPAEMLPPAEKYGAILELADRHRVLPLLYDVLAPKLPEEDENRKRLEKRSAETVRQSYRLLFLGKYVTGLLREHGIETVLLRGAARRDSIRCRNFASPGILICSLRIRKREKRRMRCCMSMDSGKPQSSTHTIISSALAQSRSE